jgi:hypothetical protein
VNYVRASLRWHFAVIGTQNQLSLQTSYLDVPFLRPCYENLLNDFLKQLVLSCHYPPLADDTTEFHDFKSLYRDIKSFQTYRKGATRRVPASQCTGRWLAANGTFRPLFITQEDGDQPLGWGEEDDLLDLVAGMSSVSTLDVRHQTPGPHWTGQQWVEYWQGRCGEVGSGEKASTTGALLAVPALRIDSLRVSKCRPVGVGEVDLLVNDVPVDAYVSYLPAKACTKFSISPAGACVWCRVSKGSVKVAVIPPTLENLTSFIGASLTASPDEATDFLPKLCQGTALVELCGEDKGVLLLPPGWVVAVAATSDTILVGGHFYRADSLSVHVDCWKLQERINSSSDNPLLSAQRLEGLFLNAEDGGMIQTRQAIHRIAATYATKVYSLAITILGGGSQGLDVAIESRRVKLIEAQASKLVKPTLVAIHDVERRSRGEEGLRKRHRRRRFSKRNEDFIVSDDDAQDDENLEEEWKPFKKGWRDGGDFSDDSFGKTTVSEGQTTEKPPFSKSREDESIRKSSRLRLKGYKKICTSFVEEEDEQGAQSNVVIRNIEKKSPRLLTKIKLGKVAQPAPTIPQLDGAGDKDSKGDALLASAHIGVDVDELSEEERHGLVDLVSGLLTWHQNWDVGQRTDIIPLIATLEVCLEVLGVSGASGLVVEGGEGRCSSANVKERDEKEEMASVGDWEIGDETSPTQKMKTAGSGRAGQNPKSQTAVQKSAKKVEMKKLSTKDRLKRKLGL